MKDEEMYEEYKKINALIKNNKLQFTYYGNSFKVELLQFVYNEIDNTMELQFRDTLSERIGELKEIVNEIKNDNKKE